MKKLYLCHLIALQLSLYVVQDLFYSFLPIMLRTRKTLNHNVLIQLASKDTSSFFLGTDHTYMTVFAASKHSA